MMTLLPRNFWWVALTSSRTWRRYSNAAYPVDAMEMPAGGRTGHAEFRDLESQDMSMNMDLSSLITASDLHAARHPTRISDPQTHPIQEYKTEQDSTWKGDPSMIAKSSRVLPPLIPTGSDLILQHLLGCQLEAAGRKDVHMCEHLRPNY